MESDGITDEKALQMEEVHSNVKLAAETLAGEKGVLSVLVTGPYAMGRVTLHDGLYFVVITDWKDGVIEHHFLEKLDTVEARIEIGKFPNAVVSNLLENGYDDMVSFRALESIRAGKVLFDTEGLGEKAVEASKRWMPEKRFIGDFLHMTRANLDDARSVFASGDYKNTVLVARAALDYAIQLSARAGKGSSGGALQDPLELAASVLSKEQMDIYNEIFGLCEMDRDKAEEILNISRDFARLTLKELGIDPTFMDR